MALSEDTRERVPLEQAHVLLLGATVVSVA
jgi:hypothetical protein